MVVTAAAASLRAAIATNRFGYGARPDEAPPADPAQWLLGQLGRYDPRPAPLADVPPIVPVLRLYNEGQAARRALKLAMKASAADAMRRDGVAGAAAPTDRLAATPAKPDEDVVAAANRARKDRYRAAVSARMATAVSSEAPFVERLVAFWSNHFAVSRDKPIFDLLAFDYEVDAIRPHVLGRFSDLLLAAEQHPAMLLYLDQTSSIGPNSPRAIRIAAKAGGQRGLNENLAREIMELHTLGVRSGYSQADVTEFARALTGWDVDGLRLEDTQAPAFRFQANQHEPGARTILGRTYPFGGEEQARAVLLDFATAPATARHVATKLARHFANDDPPPSLVRRLTVAFSESGGDLPTVYRALIEAPEAWTQPLAKFKTPWDWSVSVMRGLGRRDLRGIDAAPLLTQLGQETWKPGQPVGFDDIAATWAAPDAIMRRVELAQRLAAMVGPDTDARALAPQLLGGTLSPATATALAQAESGPTALALLLVSPEFQRR